MPRHIDQRVNHIHSHAILANATVKRHLKTKTYCSSVSPLSDKYPRLSPTVKRCNRKGSRCGMYYVAKSPQAPGNGVGQYFVFSNIMISSEVSNRFHPRHALLTGCPIKKANDFKAMELSLLFYRLLVRLPPPLC